MSQHEAPSSPKLKAVEAFLAFKGVSNDDPDYSHKFVCAWEQPPDGHDLRALAGEMIRKNRGSDYIVQASTLETAAGLLEQVWREDETPPIDQQAVAKRQVAVANIAATIVEKQLAAEGKTVETVDKDEYITRVEAARRAVEAVA